MLSPWSAQEPSHAVRPPLRAFRRWHPADRHDARLAGEHPATSTPGRPLRAPGVKQYTRELLFSTVVATMTLVACRLYKSPRSVYTEHKDHFGVTLKCFYEKLQGIELPVMREMVKDHARRCAAVIDRARRPGARLAGGLPRQDPRRQRPGRHRPPHQGAASEHGGGLAGQVPGGPRPGTGIGHRRHPLRGRPRPGTLPDSPRCCEPSKPRTCGSRTATSAPWDSSSGWPKRRGFVLVREHKGLPWRAKSESQYMGRTETGRVYEQQVRDHRRGRPDPDCCGGSSSGWTSRRATARPRWRC